MFVATRPIQKQIDNVVRDMIRSLETGNFDRIWNYLISNESIDVMSIAMFPALYGENSDSDEFLTFETVESIGFAFQTNALESESNQRWRTSWFEGFRESVRSAGWFEGYLDSESYAFLSEDSAVLVADSQVTKRAMLIPLVRDDGEFRIDFAGIIAFSMILSARRLHELATLSEHRQQADLARLLFDTTYNLEPVYARLKRLLVDNVFVRKIITPDRVAAILSELDFCILAREEAEELRRIDERRKRALNPDVLLSQLFRNYESCGQVEISQSDLIRLNDMDDTALRQALGAMMLGVDAAQLARELAKPHTGFEISDIDVTADLDGELYYISLPVKSGREIRGKSLPVSFFHQIARPQLTLERNVVVIVSAKPLSEPLTNMIKQARDHIDWKIAILQHVELARLLKRNGLLSTQ